MVINVTTQASYVIRWLLAVMSTARLFMSLPLVFPLTTAPVTKSGDTMLGLAVHKGQFDIIKYLVTECSASVNGEQSVDVIPAICGVCEHMNIHYACSHCCHLIVYLQFSY